MNRVIAAVLASAVAGSAAAQTVLYRPTIDIKDQGIGVKAWGSGVISETDEVAFEGTHSIRVSTRNFFQGGVITFGKAVPLNNEYDSKENLLRLTFRLADGGAGSSRPGSGMGFPGGGAGRPGGGAGFPGGGPGRAGGGGFPGGGPGRAGGGGFGASPAGGGGGGFGATPGRPGGGGFPGRGGQGGPGTAGGFGAPTGGPGGVGGFGGPAGAKAAPTLKTLRFLVTTSDGKKSEAYVPVDMVAPGEEGWMNVSIPLQAITGLDRTNKQITEFALAGDAQTTFYVGDLRVVNDTTPIRGEINQSDLNLGLGQEVTLSAYGFGGSSILHYTWDFDSADGMQVDAEGQTVKRRFRKAGTYTITLTISDLYGLKKPYTATMKAVVNP